MKTLVMPDVHQEVDAYESILNREKGVDIFIQLGDWFDSFNWSEEGVVRTAEAIKSFPGVKILGNHDIHYTSNKMFGCSGFNLWTWNYLKGFDWSDFVICVEVDGWLLSHAGFMNEQDIGYCLEIPQGGFRSLWSNLLLSKVGKCRGGTSAYGGPLWLDFDYEFKPIPGVKQLVGHTFGSKVRQNGMNYCIDTGLRHYAVIEDGDLQIKTV